MGLTRRQALVTIAGLVGVSTARGQSPFLTAAEKGFLEALVDTIIPRTDTPGAIDAGVPTYIDRRLAADPKLGAAFRAGLVALEASSESRFGSPFPSLSPVRRIELLTPLEKDPFVRMVKGMTVDGYYTSQEGLVQDLGWHGNTFLTEFKGCTHPEHQA